MLGWMGSGGDAIRIVFSRARVPLHFPAPHMCVDTELATNDNG
jgi:hypothetical protein